MFILSASLLLMSALQVEIHGWTLQSHHLGRKLGELRRKDESYNMMSVRDFETDASAEHLKRAIEEIANQTRVDSKTVRIDRPASLRKFTGAIRSMDSLLSDVKPTPSADFMSPTYTPQLKSAKKFWNHFMFRRRSDFQSIIPIRNNEVHQEKCRALPFLQSVTHENCETVVMKNNLCFGRCSSAHTPSSEDGLHTFCSYCSNVKFTRKAVHLKCAGDTQVTKVVTMVEDCQCELRRGRHSHQHNGPALIDPSLLGNQA